MFLNLRALKEADRVRQQLSDLTKRLKVDFGHEQQKPKAAIYFANIRKALLEGFFDQVALYQRGLYLTVKDDQLMYLHPSCGVDHKPNWVLYNEFVITQKNYIRTVTSIEGSWLLEVAPQYYNLKNFFEDSPVHKALLSVISEKGRKQ